MEDDHTSNMHEQKECATPQNESLQEHVVIAEMLPEETVIEAKERRRSGKKRKSQYRSFAKNHLFEDLNFSMVADDRKPATISSSSSRKVIRYDVYENEEIVSNKRLSIETSLDGREERGVNTTEVDDGEDDNNTHL
ncbi:hypothetical protein JRO89_XS10G0028300 [Xanthoceras sorbifolium]|uniref:Uncharacterized protein n=1 Tax=Xanthoceras sorbifolium TaxID=99658 RepID=A0ABQ8HHI6_9ROSI|nr:hypothetical protein JRO89_XS10G0028300 [Xanthoceras sorbifolium]